MQPTHVTIEIATLQAIAQYLMGCPYRDVRDLIAALQKAQPVQAEVPKAQPKAPKPAAKNGNGMQVAS
jgi:hypothetical protein